MSIEQADAINKAQFENNIDHEFIDALSVTYKVLE